MSSDLPNTAGADRVDQEMASGRFWRAKELLSGRVAGSGYDPALFARYADVLAAMKDDDEAGRYYLLGGKSDGPEGKLARAFLARRSSNGFPQLWSTMPAAARRGDEQAIPASVIEMLKKAGYSSSKIEAHFADLRRRNVAKNAQRKTLIATATERARGQRIGLVMASILLVILTVGVLGTFRLIWWMLATAFGFR